MPLAPEQIRNFFNEFYDLHPDASISDGARAFEEYRIAIGDIIQTPTKNGGINSVRTE